MNWDWLFGKDEEEAPAEKSCWCAAPEVEPSVDDSVVFVGTTAELLASIPPPPEMAEPAVEVPVEEAEVKEEETMEQEEKFDPWMNIELLKMALELEASKKQKMIFYVDVGTLPKAKIQDYLKEQQKITKDKEGDFWLPRREGGRGTEIVTTPGRVTLEGVLETAQKLKEFVNAK